MKVLNRLFVGLVLVLGTSFGFSQTYEDLVNPPADAWPMGNRDVINSRFSPLDQITPENVGQLQLQWARDLNIESTSFTPIGVYGSPSVWDGVMYIGTASGALAVDATNGALVWEYSSPNPGETVGDSSLRGSPIIMDGKVFMNLRWGATVALDAATGEELWNVALTQEELEEGFTTHPIVADGKIIVSTSGADNGGSPGRIMALNTEDGEVLWTFNTVPLDPSDPAFATWNNPPSWEAGIGGASAWNSGAYDPETRIVVYGTGQPTPWDRISERRADPEGEVGADLYSASFVALDVDTGELKWYHQVVPGDEWDYDQHTVPTFADVTLDGQERHVAVLATTTGFLVLIDAATGEFLTAHQMMPETTVHTGYEADGTAIINPEARFTAEGELFRVCPGLRWAHMAPAAFSPETGLLYRPNDTICSNYGPRVMPDDWQPGDRAWWSQGGPRDEAFFFDRHGALSAIDPVTGEVVWEYSSYYAHDAGPVVTGGGVVFSSFMDSWIRGFDAMTGEVLWQAPLTAASKAGTITYAVDGRQYVATITGGVNGGPVPTPGANVPPAVTGSAAVFVYALPE